MRTVAQLAVLTVLVAALVLMVLFIRQALRAAPGIGFQRRHLGGITTVRGPSDAGAPGPPRYRARCRCGWEGPVEESSMMALGDQQDHVMSAWHDSRGSTRSPGV